MNHEFRTVEGRRVAIVIVVVKQCMPSIDRYCTTGSLEGSNTVKGTVDGTAVGTHSGKEVGRTLHLDTVFVALKIGLSRYGVYHDQLSGRISHNAYMGIYATIVGHQHCMARETATATEHDVAL